MVLPAPVRMKSSMVSAWAVRGRVRAEERRARVKRALRIEGFPSFICRINLWDKDALVRGRCQAGRLDWRGLDLGHHPLGFIVQS
jgi:hypothetical protein